MKTKHFLIPTLALLLTATLTGCGVRSSTIDFKAERLPDLPDENGFAGLYAGVSNGALIVAGGTNFPDAAPWAGGTKTWYDNAYVLTEPDAKWQSGFKLPMPFAYGASISTDRGLLCIGGCDKQQNQDDVFLLQWDGEKLTHESLAPLPAPNSASGAVQIGSRIYLAGGQSGPNPLSGPSGSNFWVLDMGEDDSAWEALPTWPGPERFYPLLGTDGSDLYMFSGIRKIENAQGKPDLEYLRDAYRYEPAKSRWTRLPDMPRPNAAVATPLPYVNGRFIFLSNGADGVGVDQPLEVRTLGREVLTYDPAIDRWDTIARLPFARVAVPATTWRDKTIVPSGESRPGVRTNQVWQISFDRLN